MDPSMYLSGLALLGSVFVAIQSRKKVKAEAESVVVASSDRLLQMIMGQLSYMDGQVKDLQATITQYKHQIEEVLKTEGTLRARIAVLENFIRTNGLPIPPEPTKHH